MRIGEAISFLFLDKKYLGNKILMRLAKKKVLKMVGGDHHSPPSVPSLMTPHRDNTSTKHKYLSIFFLLFSCLHACYFWFN